MVHAEPEDAGHGTIPEALLELHQLLELTGEVAVPADVSGEAVECDPAIWGDD